MAYGEARKKLASFAELKQNWDTYGAPPISPCASNGPGRY